MMRKAILIEILNSLDRDAFLESLGWVFEHSPWVAKRARSAGVSRPRRKTNSRRRSGRYLELRVFGWSKRRPSTLPERKS